MGVAPMDGRAHRRLALPGGGGRAGAPPARKPGARLGGALGVHDKVSVTATLFTFPDRSRSRFPWKTGMALSVLGVSFLDPRTWEAAHGALPAGHLSLGGRIWPRSSSMCVPGFSCWLRVRR